MLNRSVSTNYVADGEWHLFRRSFTVSNINEYFYFTSNFNSVTSQTQVDFADMRLMTGVVSARVDSSLRLSPTCVKEQNPSVDIDHRMSYSWSFPYGNYISNWSFENENESWLFSDSIRGFFCHNSKVSAKSGTNVGYTYLNGDFSKKELGVRQKGIYLPPKKTYTLSFWYRKERSTSIGSLTPVIFEVGTKHSLKNYTPSTNWQLFVDTFTTISNINNRGTIDLALVDSGYATNNYNIIYFDGVVLEAGSLSDSQVRARRNEIGESVNYQNLAGMLLSSQSRVNDVLGNHKKVISHTDYDSLGRAVKSYLPYSESYNGLGYATTNRANSLYNGSNGYPNAGGRAYTQADYEFTFDNNPVKQYSPGSVFASRPAYSGVFYMDRIKIPSRFDTLNQEGDSSFQTTYYTVNWSKSPDGNYSLQWTNNAGQVEQTATSTNDVNINKINLNEWSITQSEYFVSGKLKKVITPKMLEMELISTPRI